MSQPPLDPPPLPVVPLPVVPLPVQPIYPDWSSQPRRPGVVGFIGVTSIILGSICILAGICFGFMDMGLVLMSKAASMMPTTAPTTKMINTGGTPERLPSDGMAAAQRQIVAEALSKLRPLTPNQLLQLDELLAEHGSSIVPGIASLTADQLAAGVSKAGHQTFGTGGSDYFVLGEGRLEIGEDRAVFFPTSGQPAMRSNAIQLPTNAYGSTTTGLQPDQVRSVLRTINDMNGAKIKNAQMTALAGALQNPGQQIVVPTDDGSDPAWEISSAITAADGALSVFANHGSAVASISCDVAGNITQSSVLPAGGFARVSAPTIDPNAGAATLALTIVQLGLAIYLLIIGILTVRSSPRGRLLHWIYVGLKLPVAAATAAASTWMWNSFMKSIPSGGSGTPPAALFTVALSMGSIPIAIVCIYPIALIFMLMSRSARIFYGRKEPPLQF